MGSVIHVLEDDVINKIAAGEVVENPASVVKELVENSLDAGANEITVEIKGGGRELIRVTDNGWGLSPEDAVLAFKRHATSKISSIGDLNQLATMGFRGEAIASIASVSNFTLMTRQKQGPGSLVFAQGGKIVKQAFIEKEPGTTMEVKSLFFNVPVRKKFQKSPAHDSSEVYKVVSLLALGNPDIAFHLIRDGQRALFAPFLEGSFQEQLKKRISSVLSDNYLGSCLPVEVKDLQGFIGNPSATRYNRMGQYLFINRRPVVSSLISRAVRDGYGTTIALQRFPIFVLYLTLPGFDVDVNVHPQKREIRLRDEEGVIHHIKDAVSRALSKKETKIAVVPPKFSSYQLPQEKPEKVEKILKTYSIPTEVEHPEFDFTQVSNEKECPTVIHTLPGYIFADDGKELLIVDQRRAHHRVLFDKLLEVKGEEASQNLLIPERLELTKIQKEALREHLLHLKTLGFGIRECKRQTFMVDSVPIAFSKRDIPSMMADILDDLTEYPTGGGTGGDRFLSAVAKKGAVSRSVKLGKMEALELIRDLWNSDEPGQSPNGEKIWMKMTKEAIDSLF